MNRLKKKCFLAAVGFHLLLLGILFVGPAFLTSKEEPQELTLLQFVPMVTTDLHVSGGGTPHPTSQPPEPKPAQVTPPAPRHVERAEPPKATKAPDPVAKPADSRPDRAEHRIKVNTDLITRPTSARDTSRPTSKAPDRQEQNQSKAFEAAVKRLNNDLSSSTDVETPAGPGGGGPSYANFRDTVGSAYYRAWIVPNGVDTDVATAVASVTIARSGTVVSARITKSSGNAAVDRSVQDALDRVKYIAPFPEDWKDSQRTFPINFNLKAKQALG